MKKILILAVAAAVMATAACNTIAGAGRDVSSIGKTTPKAAKK